MKVETLYNFGRPNPLLHKGFRWPFGAQDNEDEEKDAKPEGAQNDPPIGAARTKTAPTKPEEDEDEEEEEEDGELKKLTPTQLRKLIAENAETRKSIEAERDSLKQAAEEAERAKRTREENLERDLKKHQEVIDILRATNARLAIISGILAETKWQWHNPEVVAQQLDSKIVKVNDEGKVEGLTKELARVAKEHSYLLMNSGGGSATGFQPGQGGSSSKSNKAELAKDYPALLTRM